MKKTVHTVATTLLASALLLLIVLLAMIATSTYASAACMMKATWTRPTTYVDGKPLPLNEITRYELRYIQQDGSKKQGIKTAKYNTLGYSLTLPAPGLYLFNIRTVATNGLTSSWSPDVIAATKSGCF